MREVFVFREFGEENRAASEMSRYRVPVICVLVVATVAALAFVYVRYTKRR